MPKSDRLLVRENQDWRMPGLLHLIVKIKGYRREDAKEEKSSMDTYCIPA